VKIQKQQAMRNVLYALTPLVLASVYLFGWRFVAVYLVVVAAGLVCEWFMAKRYDLKVTESLFVSCSFGETSALLIILGGAFIIWKKAASWRIVTGSIASFLLFQSILWLAGVGSAVNPLYALLSGGFLLASFFMITDPVSSSQSTNEGRWIYGIIFGTLTVLIRVFANWAEGVTFAILLANMFGPLFDHLLKTAKANRKKLAQESKGGAA